MRGQIPWDEDPEVNENVVVCSFMPQTASTIPTLRPCNPGYRLRCSDHGLQLYNKSVADTFIFMNRPSAALGIDVSISIALQKISTTVMKVRANPGFCVCFAELINFHPATGPSQQSASYSN
jgi:regulator of nonsense transcripts 1